MGIFFVLPLVAWGWCAGRAFYSVIDNLRKKLWTGERGEEFFCIFILQYGGLLRVYVCDGMTGMGCPEWEVQVSRPSPASAQQQLSDASTNIYINTNLLKFKPTMKRRSEFVGGGKYSAPVCEVVAVSTEKGLCLSFNGSHGGWIEDDFEW